MTTKQPTATAFTRTQESWANFVLKKVKANIAKQEERLREDHVPVDEWGDDPILYDLYEDEIFYERYAQEMEIQRDFIKEKYLGG